MTASDEVTTTTTTPSLADRRQQLELGYAHLRYYSHDSLFYRCGMAALDAQRKALEAEDAQARQQSPQPEAEEVRQPWWFSAYDPWSDHYDATATS